MAMRQYVWCTYRSWSFQMLEALQSLEAWQTALIVTTKSCRYDLQRFEQRGTPVLRVDPKVCFKEGGEALAAIREVRPDTILHPGWSWLVPKPLLDLCPNVVLHPGKLPKDRGGSPVQNQLRNGEKWTYLNIIEMVERLDEGPIYLRERISLDGNAEDVFARMTIVGAQLTRQYLLKFAEGNFIPSPQSDEQPTVYRRVTEQDAELKPEEMSAVQMHNIIRAHYEVDPETYIKPAYLVVGKSRLVIERSSLTPSQGERSALVIKSRGELQATDLVALASEVQQGHATLAVEDVAGDRVYFNRFRVAL